MEWWQWALGIFVAGCGVLSPIVLAAMARDRTIIGMIGAAKEDGRQHADGAVREAHERINRVRDEYVRRDDLEGHLRRIEKAFDDSKTEQRRMHEQNAGEFRELKQLVNSIFQKRQGDGAPRVQGGDG